MRARSSFQVRVALLAGPVEAAAVEAGQLDRRGAPERVHVAGGEVVDARARDGGVALRLQPPFLQLGGRAMIPAATRSTGIMSRMARSATGKVRWPLKPHEGQRRAGGEALVPARERERSALSTMDGRTMAWGTPPRRDDLLAQRLGVRVRVGPAPVRARSMPSSISCSESQSCSRGPPPAAASSRRRVAGPPRSSRSRARSRKPRLQRAVVGLRADLGDAPLRVGELAPSAKSCASSVGRLGAAGHARAGAGSSRRLARPRTPPRRGCRRRSRWRRAPAPAPSRRQSSTACCGPAHVDAQRQLERGVEGHQPGAVDDHVEPGQALEVVRGRPSSGLGDVARHRDAPSRAGRPRTRPPCASRSGSKGRLWARPCRRSARRRCRRSRAHQHEDPPDARVAVQEHARARPCRRSRWRR